MIIKLLEQPIIAIHEAEVAGTVDGVIIKGSKASYIYHRNADKHFAIPVEKAIIGSDAVMIRDITAMALTQESIKVLKSMLDIYNPKGGYLGYLCGIEVDDRFNVRFLCTESHKIEMSKIVNYESIIIVDIEEADLLKAEDEVSETNEDMASGDEAISMEIGPDIKWNYENCQPEEESAEGTELSVIRTKRQNEERTVIPGVDSKYAYLYGKRLLEGIEIEETLYDKGTLIDAEVIKHAIANNAIVKVIVSAEE
ncbi:MAG TPA: hypothetical protein PLL98_09340 [Bacillota bacterium]|nr:hypothetical protein [Bacillota bacterium]